MVTPLALLTTEYPPGYSEYTTTPGYGDDIMLLLKCGSPCLILVVLVIVWLMRTSRQPRTPRGVNCGRCLDTGIYVRKFETGSISTNYSIRYRCTCPAGARAKGKDLR